MAQRIRRTVADKSAQSTSPQSSNAADAMSGGGAVHSFVQEVTARLDPVVFLAVSLGPRFAAAFGSIPPGIFVDEASSGYDAYALLHYGIDRNGFHNPVGWWRLARACRR